MNIEFLKSLLLDPQTPRTPAQATLAGWVAKCNAGIGGDNVLRHEGHTYVLGTAFNEQANGAITGAWFRFGPEGLSPLGGFTIAADGALERVPKDAELRDVLWALGTENSPPS